METEARASSARDGVRQHNDEDRPIRSTRRTALQRRRGEEPSGRGQDDVSRDPSTGLVPRVTFAARLQEQLALDLPVGLIALGLDWADGPGSHTLADATLVSAVARRITGGLRTSDLVASFGSDGFVVLVADAPVPEVLHAIARRLVAAAGGPVSMMAEQIEVRASAAYAMVRGREVRAEQVLAVGIRARQRARAMGGERVQAFDPEGGAPGPVAWPVDELERALQDGEFEAWFQPVVDVATADLCGFEAFLRWVHPALGVQEPAQFIDAAEDTGLLGRIGTEVMRQALRHLARWDARVLERPLSMGVNLSARQLEVPDLADTIGDLVAASGLPAERVRVDIAEHAVTDDPERIGEHVASLQRQGVQVCLDDFGSGSSSLTLLQRMPFDVLKLDRTLLDAIETDAGRTVFEAIVRFGHSLGLVVVAEGVESPRELAALRRAGCDQAQGRLFSGPRAARDIDTMLDRWLGQPQPAGLALPTSTSAA